MRKKAVNNYNVFVTLFVILNALITYVVTTEVFNKYITTFEFDLVGFINSFIGNVAFLLLIVTIVNVSTKNHKSKMIALIVISFLLGGILFAIHIYNRYYGMAFTFKAFAIFKNPAKSIGFSIFFESMREMITYFRIVLFIPFFVLLIYYYKVKKSLPFVPLVTPQNIFVTGFAFVLLFFTNLVGYSAIAREVEIVDSAKAAHKTQYIGIYNYLLVDAVGYQFKFAEHIDFDEEELKLDVIAAHDRNYDSYTNFIDGNNYTKEVLLKDVNNISGSLLDGLNGDDSLTGILEDYNLVLIHLESFNYFLLENPILNQYFYNLKFLLSESYVFENFYTTVGLGNSSDAELAVLAGIYSNGTSTPFWDYDLNSETTKFELQAIPKLFNQKNYQAMSYHGNFEIFYNRDIVHPNMLGFSKFHSRETMLEHFDMDIRDLQDLYNHRTGEWLSDRIVLDYLNDEIDQNLLNNEKFFKFIITMLPHLPYQYDPYPNYPNMFPEEFMLNFDSLALKYFNYIKYYNEIFKMLLEDVDGYGDDYQFDEDNLYSRPKTAYIFYGDHGAGLDRQDINNLYGGNLEPGELKAKELQTLSFIYVPGSNNITKTIDGVDVTFKEGQLKGTQSLVRDQIDLYRTITDLFNLPLLEEDILFGVHGMSTEPSYVIDNKSLYLITDDYITNLTNNNTNFLFNELVTLEELNRFKRIIISFKRSSDYVLNNNLYQTLIANKKAKLQ